MSRRPAIAPTATDARRAGRWRRVLLPALLATVTLAVYAQTVWFGYMTVDDHDYVSQNAHVQQGITWSGIVWSFTTVHDSNWIPLTWLSLMLDSNIYGVRPGGYHLTNILLHALNTLLLYAALAAATRNSARSAFVAALFALHPLHVESVAWIAERKDVLSTFFGLFSLLLYVRYAKGATRWRLVGSFFLLVASLLSKQTLVTLPFVFLLLDFWPLARIRSKQAFLRPSPMSLPADSLQQSSRTDSHEQPASLRVRTLPQLVIEKLPFFVAVFAFSAAAMLAQTRGGAVRTVETLPLYVREMNAVWVYVLYLWKALFPHNLAIYYPYPGPELTWSVVTLSAAFLLAVTAVALLCIRRLPFLVVGWFWYLGTLLPMIGLVQIGSQQMADRYTYFPLIGIFLAVAWLVPELIPGGAFRTRVLPVVACGVTGVMAVATFRQVSLWRDNVVLLRHSQECTADHLLAHQFLGSALVAEGSLSEGIAELQTAVRMGPHSARAHSALALALERAGRLDESADQYREALAIDDRMAEIHNNLGYVLLKQRKFAEAKQQYLRALAIDDSLVDAHVNLAFLCLTLREYPEAIKQAQRALGLKPKTATACRICIGLALRGEGRLDEAVRTLQQAVDAAPDDQIARQELARTIALRRRVPGPFTPAR